jgi:hypothetical protein
MRKMRTILILFSFCLFAACNNKNGTNYITGFGVKVMEKPITLKQLIKQYKLVMPMAEEL